MGDLSGAVNLRPRTPDLQRGRGRALEHLINVNKSESLTLWHVVVGCFVGLVSLIMKGLFLLSIDNFLFPCGITAVVTAPDLSLSSGPHRLLQHCPPSTPGYSLITECQEPSKEKDSRLTDRDQLGMLFQGDSGRVWGLPGLEVRRGSVLETMKLAPGEPWERGGEEWSQGGRMG